MRLTVIVVVALMAFACGSPPRQEWVNLDRLDRDTWGEVCGPAASGFHLRPGQAGVSYLSWESRSSAPSITCNLNYDNRTGSLWQLDVTAFGSVNRTTAEKLIGDLVLPYLPPDVQLAARAAAFGVGTELASYRYERKVGHFTAEGGFQEGKYFRINVSLGKPPMLGP